MNIQLGIYEIFSTIIPGCVYLVAICDLFLLTGAVSFDWKAINNATLVAAYLLGLIFGWFGLLWYKRFKKVDISVDAFIPFPLQASLP
jgi:hypothetical protein